MLQKIEKEKIFLDLECLLMMLQVSESILEVVVESVKAKLVLGSRTRSGERGRSPEWRSRTLESH